MKTSRHEALRRIGKHLFNLPLSLSLPIVFAAGVGQAFGQNVEFDDQQGGTATIPLASGSDVQIDPVTGNLRAQPQPGTEAWSACLGAGDSDTCRISIGNTFNASEGSVSQGGSIQFSWDARGAWECVGFMEDDTGNTVTSTTWDDDPSRLPAGSDDVGTANLDPGDYFAFLSCTNGPSSDLASVPFTVTDPNPDAPDFCSTEGRVPPGGMIRDQAMLWDNQVPSQPLDDQTVAWDEFWFNQFPRGETTSFEIRPDHYGTLAFSTGTTPIGATGQITFETPQFSQGTLSPGDKLVTISQCPGDFTDRMEDPECRKVIANSDMRWKIGSSIEADFRCTLRQNTTYFLNILYTADANVTPLQWGCTGGETLDSRCGNRADHLE
mgnify:CR=1 FL=1